MNISFSNVTSSAAGPNSKFDLLQRKTMDGHCLKLLPKASLQMLIFRGQNLRSVVDELFGKLHETPHISFRPSVPPSVQLPAHSLRRQQTRQGCPERKSIRLVRFYLLKPSGYLNFRHRALCIQDRRFATLQRTLFIYLINKYISLSDICLTVHH